MLCGLAVTGQLVLLASAWLLPFASEYSLTGDNISELVLGRNRGVQALALRDQWRGHRQPRRRAAFAQWHRADGAGLVPTDRFDSPADRADPALIPPDPHPNLRGRSRGPH